MLFLGLENKMFKMGSLWASYSEKGDVILQEGLAKNVYTVRNNVW